MRIKSRQKPRLNFPPGSGDYWFLYWIGEVRRDSKGFTIDLHFVNTDDTNDHINHFNQEEKIIITKPIFALSFYTIGCIFNSAGKIILHPKEYQRYTHRVTVSANFHSTTKPLPIEVSCKYPFPKDDGYRYFFLSGDHHYFKKHPIILPVHTLCNHFYFLSPWITELLTDNRLDEVINFRSRQIFELSNGEKIGRLEYNNLALKRHHAQQLAGYFFTKELAGAKGLNSISANLLSTLLNNRSNFRSYLDTSFPYASGCNLVLHGKFIKNKPDEYIFLVYEIINSNAWDRSLLVDRIILKPMFPNSSTDDRGRHIPKSINKSKGEDQNDENITISSNRLEGNPLAPIEELHTTDNMHKFDIPIEFEEREDQFGAYTTNSIILPTLLDELTMSLDDMLAGSEKLRADLLKEKIVLSRFEYLVLLCNILNKDYGINVYFPEVGNYIESKKGSYYYKNGLHYEYTVIELDYESAYFYLIEFEQGLTGLIHHIHGDQIDALRLELFIDEVVKCDIEWSPMYQHPSKFILKYQIRVLQPTRHQTRNFETGDELISHAAGKIYDKIKRANV